MGLGRASSPESTEEWTMSRYRNPAIRLLKEQQVKFAPRDVRLQQLEQAERLLEDLDPAREYRYPELCKRITGITAFRPEQYPDLIVSGEDAAHDLRLFVEDL